MKEHGIHAHDPSGALSRTVGGAARRSCPILQVWHRALSVLFHLSAWMWADVLASDGARCSALLGSPDGWVAVFGGPDPCSDEVRELGARPGPVRDLGSRVRALLAELGPGPGDVAASLHAAMVRVGLDEPGVNPVARYLAAVVGADPEVTAVQCDGRSLRVVRARGGSVSVAVPAAVATFTDAFEHGCYPELVRPRRPQGEGSGRKGTAW